MELPQSGTPTSKIDLLKLDPATLSGEKLQAFEDAGGVFEKASEVPHYKPGAKLIYVPHGSVVSKLGWACALLQKLHSQNFKKTTKNPVPEIGVVFGQEHSCMTGLLISVSLGKTCFSCLTCDHVMPA